MNTERQSDGTHKISVKLAEQLYMFLAGVDKSSSENAREKEAAHVVFERACQKHQTTNSKGQEVFFVYEEEFYRFLCDKCSSQVGYMSDYGDNLPALLFGLQQNDPDFDINLPERLQARVDDIEFVHDEP